MAGFVAAGVLRGDQPIVHANELSQDDATRSPASPSAKLVVDVRTPAEFAAGHIDQAINIPLEELRGRLAELPRDRPIATYCQVGQRGYMATRLLLQKGLDAANVSGGYLTWTRWHDYLGTMA